MTDSDGATWVDYEDEPLTADEWERMATTLGLRASLKWQWSIKANRYRDTKTGRFVSQATIQTLRDSFIVGRMERMDQLAQQVAGGQRSIQEWVTAMRDEVRQTYASEYIFGRGGVNAMTQADWGRLGRMIRDQYAYLQDFAATVANGDYSEGQIRTRAHHYVGSAVQAFERAVGIARGWPDLPAYPGDGQTTCFGNCRCTWTLVRTDDGRGWNATWVTSDDERECEDCISNGKRWAPLFVGVEA